MIKIIFFGTHNFAAAILESLLKDKNFKILAVVTQPDKPAGRKQKIIKSPIKLLAEKQNLKIFQPESLTNYSLLPTPYSLNLVCQYGLLIPRPILELPQFGSINIHPSLLPLYRGPSPIQSALMDGAAETGVSIMLMDEKMDHGPILAQEKIAIDDDDTSATLAPKLEKLSSKLLLSILPRYLDGKIKPIAQDKTKTTFCHLLERDSGKINFTNSAQKNYNLYRGLTPWPGIFTFWQGKRLKLLQIKPAALDLPAGAAKIHNNELYFGCSSGSIQILELQPEGKKPMTARQFLFGYKNIDGQTLG